jgi:phosphoribosylglycinamide formyltransferase-1
MSSDHKKNIIIFASGAGSNAQQIINYFKKDKTARVALIVCNNPKAGVLTIAANEHIPVLLISKKEFSETGYLAEIKKYDPALIVLAGFLWMIPGILIHDFPHKIINIHPALLPAYGGKGMYGSAVHESVVNAKEKESGITIHYVDEKYDHGKTIFQARCGIDENETPHSLAEKIHKLEHEYYPKVIAELLKEETKSFSATK